jgi:hypothetical protein
MVYEQKPEFVFRQKRTSPFKSRGVTSVQSTGNRGVRISGSNPGYTMFRGSVKGSGYPLHSPVSPFTSPPLRHRDPSHFNWTLWSVMQYRLWHFQLLVHAGTSSRLRTYQVYLAGIGFSCSLRFVLGACSHLLLQSARISICLLLKGLIRRLSVMVLEDATFLRVVTGLSDVVRLIPEHRV